MLIKIGELKVDKNKDYKGEQIKCLENAGFIVIKTLETFSECFYEIARGEKE